MCIFNHQSFGNVWDSKSLHINKIDFIIQFVEI